MVLANPLSCEFASILQIFSSFAIGNGTLVTTKAVAPYNKHVLKNYYNCNGNSVPLLHRTYIVTSYSAHK